ncbi:alpha/beta hydrolase [Fulvivirga sp.]|uniref:alpha/beta fold hydrolase n=1 Tax=Fulvivirga sp. TaxID=1931237 RepID=UPI0032EFD910
MSSIYSEVRGEGNPVILIHGFCETLAIWKPLLNKLVFSHKVITLDLPGFGKSPLPKTPFSIADIAEEVYQWMKENQLLNSVIIGHSLGGYVSLALTEKYPDSIKGFGLFHSTAFADDDEKKHSRNKTIAFVRKRGVKVFADSFVSQLIFVKNRDRLDKEISVITSDAANTNQESLVAYMEAMRDRPDRTGVLKSFDKPVLFIAGDQDTSVPFDKSQAQFGLIKNPHLKVLKDVGHMGMYEATSESFEVISKYLAVFEESNSDNSQSGVLPDRDLKKNLGCG